MEIKEKVKGKVYTDKQEKIARSTLSQHLKELTEAGLIQGEISPPYIKYCINKTGLSEARELLGTFLNRK